uniref:Histidine kinase/HSP90-like ATPase domain-containing protein n=1 Tax=Globodera rostochiensis TaxID=31243 RepID=A0A914H125_GLORO
MISRRVFYIWAVAVFALAAISPNFSIADKGADVDEIIDEPTVETPKNGVGKGTDDQAVQREEEAIKLDGLSVSEFKQLRESAEKHQFQAEVSRMMKLIINSLYRNKEIFLRELISNASDALDKIRLISLTNSSALAETEELSIKIKADKENHILHITDTGLGMTKQDMINNLGTIARSGTSEFISKLLDSSTSSDQQQDLIGQFGVGFYSAFLVADRVVVTSKHNDDSKQYIWESDSSQFSIVEDPRGPTLLRGTQVSLHLKEEAYDFLEPDTLKKLIQKYSQFINFDILLWQSRTETIEEPVEESEEEKEAEEKKKEEEKKPEEEEEKKEDELEEKKPEEEEGKEEEEKKPKTKMVEKTLWDWQKVNTMKPIWMRKPAEVVEDEYKEFYKSITKDFDEPLGHVHFTAEGEVSFKSILYVPKTLATDAFQNYGKTEDNIKLYVRRVFITDDFQDMLPKYLSFIRGIVDSDDLPLNVSRENLQQHKLLKVIKKKLVRKVLDMLKKIAPEKFDEFWKEYSTNLKLGVMEDPSADPEKQTTLEAYVERMKEKQQGIYYMAGTSREEVENSPFVERLLKKGFEVLYLTEPVDEYCIQSMPEFESKKFQNVAKEGLKLDDGGKSEEQHKLLEEQFKPLCDWLKNKGLNDKIEKAVVSQRLTKSPSALVASSWGWSGNMERIMKSQAYAKARDPSQEFYAKMKKTFEINPRHPVVRELLRRVEEDAEDPVAQSTAHLLFETATLRSGYSLDDQVGFAERIEGILRKTLDLSATAEVEEELEIVEEEESEKKAEEGDDEEAGEQKKQEQEHGEEEEEKKLVVEEEGEEQTPHEEL